MTHVCYRRRDEFPVMRAYTVRYIGTPESAVEVYAFASEKHPKAKYCSYTTREVSFTDEDKRITVPHGSFLVLTAGDHFETMTEKEFFEEYYIA